MALARAAAAAPKSRLDQGAVRPVFLPPNNDALDAIAPNKPIRYRAVLYQPISPSAFPLGPYRPVLAA